jgi:ATP-dependent Clp protease adaptor protein ClpS
MRRLLRVRAELSRGLPALSGDGDRPDDDGPGGPGGPGGDVALVPKTKPKSKRPAMYKVLLLNDDYTPMEFVVHVLQRFFGLSQAYAVELMLTVHRKGVAVVGVFSYEIAETKVTQVMEYAQRNEHPLQCTMEKE